MSLSADTVRRDPDTITLASADGRLTVAFRWDRDRFTQRLLVADSKQGHSVDGDADQWWPPSPPIQQLSLESIAGKDVLLGVGGAGMGHWSISVECHEDSALKFDVACRCSEGAEWLGSCYQLEPELQLETLAESSHEPHELGQAIVPVRTGAESTYRWSYLIRPANK